MGGSAHSGVYCLRRERSVVSCFDISVDIHYGCPNRSGNRWQRQIATLLSSNTPPETGGCYASAQLRSTEGHTDVTDAIINDVRPTVLLC